MSDETLYGGEYEIERGAERETLLGVVEPHTDYDTATQQVNASLSAVQARLKLLRDEREAINAEVKRLVGHEDILQRMQRVAHSRTRHPSTHAEDAAHGA